jgi:hypothetical protein
LAAGCCSQFRARSVFPHHRWRILEWCRPAAGGPGECVRLTSARIMIEADRDIASVAQQTVCCCALHPASGGIGQHSLRKQPPVPLHPPNVSITEVSETIAREVQDLRRRDQRSRPGGSAKWSRRRQKDAAVDVKKPRGCIADGRREVTMQNARKPSLRRVRGLIILTIILMACYGLHQVGANGIDRALTQATAALEWGPHAENSYPPSHTRSSLCVGCDGTRG